MKATSSPIRVEKAAGHIFFRITGYDLHDGKGIRNGFEVSHPNYQIAKKMFWAEWKALHPEYFLDARLSK